VSIRLLEELVQISDRDLLDVGCGEGAVARRLAEAGARVVGLDPLPGAIGAARAATPEGPLLRYLQGSAEALPFAAGSFDVVIFFNSLHHVPLGSMGPALDEAARVLRPGGTLYVQEPLAQGPAFELLRRIEDETAARSAALEALATAGEGPFEGITSRETVLTVRHADFAALRARTVSVDPARGSAFDAQHEELYDAFQRLGRPAEAGGYEFDQPFRIELLRRRD
jgi:SAM-dependent methyltransferase